MDTTGPRICGVSILQPLPCLVLHPGQWRIHPGRPPDWPASRWGPAAWDMEVTLGARFRSFRFLFSHWWLCELGQIARLLWACLPFCEKGTSTSLERKEPEGCWVPRLSK